MIKKCIGFHVQYFHVQYIHVKYFHVHYFHVQYFHVQYFHVQYFHVQYFHVQYFHVQYFHVQYLFLFRFSETPIFIDFFCINTQVSSIRNIHPQGVELFRMDEHDEASSRFSQFCDST
jgi:hypothetical protein